MSETFKVVNMYSGNRAGKTMFQAQRMMIEYVGKHMGKPIEIIQCDHEKIESLISQLEKAEKVISRTDRVYCNYPVECDHENINNRCASCYTREAAREYFKDKEGKYE